jgi:hypothetical protein
VTVFARAFVFLGFTVLAIIKMAKPIMILFGVIDLLAGVWTLLALLLV